MPQQVQQPAVFLHLSAPRPTTTIRVFAMRRIPPDSLAAGRPRPFGRAGGGGFLPQAESDLRADPSARYGTLSNGLRYVVMANHEPKNRASLQAPCPRRLVSGDRGPAGARPLPRAHGLQREHALRAGHPGREAPAPGHGFRRRHERVHLVRAHPLPARTARHGPGDPGRGTADPGRLRGRPAAPARHDRKGARDHHEREEGPGLGGLPHARGAAWLHRRRHPRSRAPSHRAGRRDREILP